MLITKVNEKVKEINSLFSVIYLAHKYHEKEGKFHFHVPHLDIDYGMSSPEEADSILTFVEIGIRLAGADAVTAVQKREAEREAAAKKEKEKEEKKKTH